MSFVLGLVGIGKNVNFALEINENMPIEERNNLCNNFEEHVIEFVMCDIFW